MDDLTFWMAAVLASVCVGLAKGGLSLVGALAVPILALTISPVTAAAMLLPVFVVSDVIGLIAYRRQVDPVVLKIMMVAMPLGVLVGYLTVDIVSDAVVTTIIGAIGAVFSLSLIMRRKADVPPKSPAWPAGLFWGGITGFTSFVSHTGAVPYQVFTLPLRMPKMIFAGTVTVAFAYINLIKLIPYFLLGQLSLGNLKIAVILLAPAAIGVAAGLKLVKILPERLFFRFITGALLVLSCKLLWDGLTSLI
ncbi:sulfite exporter TauE/SafE family protein [Yoonia sp. SS1-5]|uniref:Probable membrane transporter protein n=1 Tax=Yoonia rhodophyticola TaxID=3137370 RepID=A0AAN0NKJ8_9RHOB